MSLHLAILGPCETAPLREHLPALADDASAPPGMGGSNIVNLVLARLARGMKTDLITLDPRAREPIERFSGPLLRLWIVKRRERRALRDAFAAERRLQLAALDESGAEVCHANWTCEYGMAAIAQNRVPAVVSVHDHAGNVLRHAGWRYLPHYLISRLVIARARHLTAVSPYIAAYLESLTHRSVPVVPNLLSELVWRRAREAQAPGAPGFQIASALTWTPFRNVRRALRAFRRLRLGMPDATWVIVGPGCETNGPAHAWACANGCEAGVEFRGRVPYAAALDLLATSALVFHPSLEESFGSPVAEAMALGKPVIATREAGGPRWLLEEGRAGFLADGRDEDDLAATLERACRATRDGDSALAGTVLAARSRIAALCDAGAVLDAGESAFAAALA